jgi:hypothetical protein
MVIHILVHKRGIVQLVSLETAILGYDGIDKLQ